MNNLQLLCGVEQQKHIKSIQPNYFNMQQRIIPSLQ